MNDRLCGSKFFCLSSSSLKILACILMTVDHIGLVMFPDIIALRIIGRLSFPIFAFFVAEGCRFSKNKVRRVCLIAVIGVVYALAYYIYYGSLYGNIFLTFSVSIAVIYVINGCKKWVFDEFHMVKALISVALILFILFGAYVLFRIIRFEYGYFGMLVPVWVSLPNFSEVQAPRLLCRLDSHLVRLLCLTLGLILVSIDGQLGNIQYCCLLSVVILLFYNGEIGRPRLKYAFYIYYPLHLLAIECVSIIIN